MTTDDRITTIRTAITSGWGVIHGLNALDSLAADLAAAATVLPDDMVCACLDETGGRTTRLYERCDRCRSFMDASHVTERLAAAEVDRGEARSLHTELAVLLGPRTPREGVTANDYWISQVVALLARAEAAEARATEAERRYEWADAVRKAAAEALHEALHAMLYVHTTCNCKDGEMPVPCARCRAVTLLGSDPAVLAGEQPAEPVEGRQDRRRVGGGPR